MYSNMKDFQGNKEKKTGERLRTREGNQSSRLLYQRDIAGEGGGRSGRK